MFSCAASLAWISQSVRYAWEQSTPSPLLGFQRLPAVLQDVSGTQSKGAPPSGSRLAMSHEDRSVSSVGPVTDSHRKR